MFDEGDSFLDVILDSIWVCLISIVVTILGGITLPLLNDPLTWLILFAIKWGTRLGILFVCLIPPLFLYGIYAVPPNNVSSRRKALHHLFQISTAAISGCAISVVILWNLLGVPPPADDKLLSGVSAFSCIYGLIGVAVILRCAKCMRLIQNKTLGSAAAIAFIGGINICFFSLPVWWTVHKGPPKISQVQVVALVPRGCPTEVTSPLVVHISDLHITTDRFTRDGKTPGNLRFPGLIKEINRQEPSYLVISGDLTDRGDVPQWMALKEMLGQLAPASRVIITPGNHDLNQFFGHDPNEADIGWGDAEITSNLEKLPRLGRLTVFESQSLPTTVTAEGVELGDLVRKIPTKSTLHSFEKQISQCIDNCNSAGAWDETGKATAACGLVCGTDWRHIRFQYLSQIRDNFPWMYVDEQRHVAFFSIASTLIDSDTAGQNGLGYISQGQLSSLQRLLHELPLTIRLVVLTLHHPLFNPPPPSIPTLAFSELLHPIKLWNKIYLSPWFMAVFLNNDPVRAGQLYTIVSKELAERGNTSAILMFGHRHLRSLARIANAPNIILEEAPNVATEIPGDYGFYAVTVEANDEPTVHWCELKP